VQQAVSRAGRWPHCRAVIVAEHRRGPSTRNIAQRPSGPPLGVVAQDVRCRPCVVTMSASSARLRPSGVRCECLVSRCAMSTRGVQCPSVRCGRLPVRVSDARVGVRFPCVPASVASEPGQVLEYADGLAAGRGPRRRRAVSTTGSVAAPVGASRSKPAQVCWAGGASTWNRPSSWEVVEKWPGRPRGDQAGPDAPRDRASVGVRVRLLSAVIV
jgi:hypothetical protein